MVLLLKCFSLDAQIPYIDGLVQPRHSLGLGSKWEWNVVAGVPPNGWR